MKQLGIKNLYSSTPEFKLNTFNKIVCTMYTRTKELPNALYI